MRTTSCSCTDTNDNSRSRCLRSLDRTMASDREYCSKGTPHSTNSMSSATSAKSEKAKRNHAVLIQWVETHHDNPYPTKAEKHCLASYANMTQRQLNDWFANARRNIKKIGFAAWKAKHSPTLIGSRSRRHLSTTVHSEGHRAQVIAGAIDSKSTYHFPTLYSTPMSAPAMAISQVMQNGSYLPTARRGLIPLPVFNRPPVPTQLGAGSSLYTLYPSHTSTQCSCTSSIPTFSSHGLGTMPVFSRFNPSLVPGVLKYNDGVCSSFTPPSHVSDLLPCAQLHSIGNTNDHPDNQNALPTSSPQQGHSEAQTPPEQELLDACKCCPSSIQSVTPLEQEISRKSLCPTLPTRSESASIARCYTYDHDSVISASMPDQGLCALNRIVYDSRPPTKPLFHLPDTNVEIIAGSSPTIPSSQSNPQWMWNGINSTSIYEAELPELPVDSIKDEDYPDLANGGLNPTPAQLCLDQANSP